MHSGLGTAARKGLKGTVVILSLLLDLVSSPPIPRTLSRPFINRRNLGPLSRAPLQPLLRVRLNVQVPLYSAQLGQGVCKASGCRVPPED